MYTCTILKKSSKANLKLITQESCESKKKPKKKTRWQIVALDIFESNVPKNLMQTSK